MPLPWPYPLCVLDFEASSLEHDGYPIEVGVATLNHPDAELSSWSTLIQPTTTWKLGGHWSKASQRVHKIAREELAGAPLPRAVMRELNERIARHQVVICDGGAYDAFWLASLAKAAGIDPAFELIDVAMLLADDPDMIRRASEKLAETPTPHRAGADALRLMLALRAAMQEIGSMSPSS